VVLSEVLSLTPCQGVTSALNLVTFVESLFGEYGQQDNSPVVGEVIRDSPGLIRIVEAEFEKSGTEGFRVGETHLIADFGEAFDER
jgi:hypothetical protein